MHLPQPPTPLLLPAYTPRELLVRHARAWPIRHHVQLHARLAKGAEGGERGQQVVVLPHAGGGTMTRGVSREAWGKMGGPRGGVLRERPDHAHSPPPPTHPLPAPRTRRRRAVSEPLGAPSLPARAASSCLRTRISPLHGFVYLKHPTSPFQIENWRETRRVLKQGDGLKCNLVRR